MLFERSLDFPEPEIDLIDCGEIYSQSFSLVDLELNGSLHRSELCYFVEDYLMVFLQ